MSSRTVSITQEGRGGTVTYTEPAGSVRFWWEFGGGDALAIIQVESGGAWGATFLAGRHEEVLRYVASEVVRRQAPGHRFELDAATGAITIFD